MNQTDSATQQARPLLAAPDWLALCGDCDLLSRIGDVPLGGTARCPRCGHTLYRRIPDSVDRTLALALAGLVLFAVANAFPFLALEMQSNLTETTLVSGVNALYEQGRPFVASLVLFTTIAAPFCHLLALLYVLGSLKLGVRMPAAVAIFRALRRIQNWSMIEVFMLGILVALVKLADMAQIVPGIALWSFALLIPVVAGATSSLDAELVWRRIGFAS